MLVGCQNSPFYDKDPVEGVVELARWGVEAVEFVADRPRSLPRQINQESRAKIRMVTEEAGLSLTVHSPFKGQDLTSPFPRKAKRSLEEAEGAIELAHDLGAVGVVIHPGRGRVLPSLLPGRVGFLDGIERRLARCSVRRLDNASRNSAVLGRLLERAGSERVGIYLENLPKLVDARSVFVECLEHNSDLCVCYDYGHSLLGDWGWLLEDHFDRIGYVHCHLNAGRSDDHNPISAEDLRLRGFLKRLADSGYGGTVMIEPMVGDLQGARMSVDAVRGILGDIAGEDGFGGC